MELALSISPVADPEISGIVFVKRPVLLMEENKAAVTICPSVFTLSTNRK